MQDFSNVKVVLVNPSHPGNIGASARAMKNMGLENMTLVQPEQFPSGVAVGRAASAVDVLESAIVVNSLRSAVAECGLVIGASARSRRIPWPMLTPEQCAAKIISEKNTTRVALVFGREDSGLNNDDLQLCHYHVQIHANETYNSLNLASAVMVICYELRKVVLKAEELTPRDKYNLWDQETATGEQVESFYEHLERVMVTIGFHDPENPRQLMHRIRRLFGRIRIDMMELNILRGILTNVEKKIKGKED